MWAQWWEAIGLGLLGQDSVALGLDTLTSIFRSRGSCPAPALLGWWPLWLSGFLRHWWLSFALPGVCLPLLDWLSDFLIPAVIHTACWCGRQIPSAPMLGLTSAIMMPWACSLYSSSLAWAYSLIGGQSSLGLDPSLPGVGVSSAWVWTSAHRPWLQAHQAHPGGEGSCLSLISLELWSAGCGEGCVCGEGAVLCSGLYFPSPLHILNYK